jgi:hypothetical protein
MIKVGDKVICIEDYSCQGSYVDQITHSYKIGKRYEIIKIEDEMIYILADLNKEDAIFIGVWFRICDDKLFGFDVFHDYFITLAEWREQQINSILDD